MDARGKRLWLGAILSVMISAGSHGQFVAPVQFALPAGLPGSFVGPAISMIHVPPQSPRSPGKSAGRGQSVGQSQNFIVFASSPQWAEQVVQVAEQQRRDLAVHWFGQELPSWSQRCPIHVQDAENLGAGGETRFALAQGVPGNWMMSVQGTQERILDSVLPHEITHTLFATYFGRYNKYVPRWADEGAATTVEHEAEKKKHRHFLKQFLKTGRGLAFNEMFRLKEYPQDILPLYAQGHSAVQFLIDQDDPQHFVRFLEAGMQTDNWPGALHNFYGYESIGDFQLSWNRWLIDGSPSELVAYSPKLRNQSSSGIALASQDTVSSNEFSEHSQPLARLPNVPTDSWFRNKLRSVSGKPATPIPPHNHYSGDGGHYSGTGLHELREPTRIEGAIGRNHSSAGDAFMSSAGASSTPPSALARPQQLQTPGIQVLDWGGGGAVSGLRSDNSSLPILR